MTALSPLLLPAFLGWSFLLLILHNVRLPQKGFFIITLGPAVGLALISLILFFCYVSAGGRHAYTLVLLMSTLLLFACLILYLQRATFKVRLPSGSLATAPPRKSRPAFVSWLLTAAALAVFFLFYRDFFIRFWSQIGIQPLGGWDARFLWQIKARFLFRDPEQWTLLFSEQVGWSNHGYPLMFPGMMAWGWIWGERENLLWPPVVAFVMMSTLCAVIVWYLRAYGKWWQALLGGSFFISISAYRFWSEALYADVALAAFLTVSLALLICAMRERSNPVFFLSGLFAGFGAWLKDEGILALVCLTALLGLALAMQAQREKSFPLRSVLFFLAGCVVPLLAVWILKTFYAPAGSYLFRGKGIEQYAALLMNRERMLFILMAFLTFMRQNQWHMLWGLFLASLAIYPLIVRKSYSPGYLWLFALGVLIVNTAYAFVYMITPIDLRFHIETSLTRVILHTGGWALLFAFEVFSIPPKDKFSMSAGSLN